MESPHHSAPDPGSHPRIATEAAHPGACSRQPPPPPQRNPDVHGGMLTHVFCDAKTPRGRANEGSTEIKTLPATLVSVCLWGSGSLHYCREIHSNPTKPLSANDMASLRTHSFIWGTLMKRQAAGSPKSCYSTGAAA